MHEFICSLLSGIPADLDAVCQPLLCSGRSGEAGAPGPLSIQVA